MNFWRWYLGVCKYLISFRWVCLFTQAISEGVIGYIMLGAGILGTITISPWFLLLILAGINITAHGFWRLFVKK